MKTLKYFSFFVISFGIFSHANAVNLDSYLGKQGRFFYDGKQVSNDYPALIEKETVQVLPLGETMTRYVFRSQWIPHRLELAYFTIYMDSEGNYYSYMDDRAYLRAAVDSFVNVPKLNPNKWVAMNENGNKLDCVFYPGDLGEQKYSFEFRDDSIVVKTFEWEQLLGMIPLPKYATAEFQF